MRWVAPVWTARSIGTSGNDLVRPYSSPWSMVPPRPRNVREDPEPSSTILPRPAMLPRRHCAAPSALRRPSPSTRVIGSRFWSHATLTSGRSINCRNPGHPIRSEAPVSQLEQSALALTLRDLEPVLGADGVTELCINRPGEAYVESAAGWQRVPLTFAGFDWCLRLCKLVANATQQRIDEQFPLLSASLPGGERIQLVMPPATPAHMVSITIRKPAPRTWSLDEMAQRGIFERTYHGGGFVDPVQEQLVSLLRRREYVGFMRLAVTSKRNILVSGPTGSGKTTWTKALIREIPADERLIS